MDQEEVERLTNLSEKQLLIDDLKTDYGLSHVEADALYDKITVFGESYHPGERSKSQIVKTVVAIGQSAGKPIKLCKKVEVLLTVLSEEDIEIRRMHGIKAERRARELRLSAEAVEQGGVLSAEQLAHILCVSKSTIKRDRAVLALQGIAIPTRGEIEDIGPGQTHKAKAIEFVVLKGFSYTETARKIHHSPESIARYVEAFGAVAFLTSEGYSPLLIRKVTKISERVIREYLQILEQARADGFGDRVDAIIARFKELYEIKKKMMPDWNYTGNKGAGGSK